METQGTHLLLPLQEAVLRLKAGNAISVLPETLAFSPLVTKKIGTSPVLPRIVHASCALVQYKACAPNQTTKMSATTAIPLPHQPFRTIPREYFFLCEETWILGFIRIWTGDGTTNTYCSTASDAVVHKAQPRLLFLYTSSAIIKQHLWRGMEESFLLLVPAPFTEQISPLSECVHAPGRADKRTLSPQSPLRKNSCAHGAAGTN